MTDLPRHARRCERRKAQCVPWWYQTQVLSCFYLFNHSVGVFVATCRYDQWFDDVIISVSLLLLSCWQLVSNQTLYVYFQGVVSLCQCHQRSWAQWSFQNHHHSCNNSHYQCHNQSLFNWHHHYHQQLTSEKDFVVIFLNVENMISQILRQRCWSSKIIGLNIVHKLRNKKNAKYNRLQR